MGLTGQYTHDKGLQIGCSETEGSAALWSMIPTIPDNPFRVPEETSAYCPQFGGGMIREFVWDVSTLNTPSTPSGVYFGGFPQFAVPVAVAIVVVEDLAGSGDNEGVGDIWIKNIGIRMREQGSLSAIGQDTNNFGWDRLDGYTSFFAAKPIACAGDGPKFYQDDHYFYHSASMANCCFPPLSGAMTYAVYGANQGGEYFSGPRWTGEITPAASGLGFDGAIAASFDRTNVVYPTSSYINMTQYPMNDVTITLNKRMTTPATGKIRICCYFHRIAGGAHDSTNFFDSTPEVTGSGYTGPKRGIYGNCVSGTIIP